MKHVSAFSLVEILVALAISAALALGYSSLLQHSSALAENLNQQQNRMDDAQAAIHVLRHAVALAGFQTQSTQSEALYTHKVVSSSPQSSQLAFEDTQNYVISTGESGTFPKTQMLTLRYLVEADGLTQDCFGHSVSAPSKHDVMLELSFFVSLTHTLTCKASYTDLNTGMTVNLGREPIISHVADLQFELITLEGYVSPMQSIQMAQPIQGVKVTLALSSGNADKHIFVSHIANRQTRLADF